MLLVLIKMCLEVGKNVCLVCVLVSLLCPINTESKSSDFETPITGVGHRNLQISDSRTSLKSNVTIEDQQKILEQTVSDKSKFFMHKLFQKYGANGLITFEGFEHLLENLGLGNIKIHDHALEDHKDNETFNDLHGENHDHSPDKSSDLAHSEHDHEGHHHEEKNRKTRSIRKSLASDQSVTNVLRIKRQSSHHEDHLQDSHNHDHDGQGHSDHGQGHEHDHDQGHDHERHSDHDESHDHDKDHLDHGNHGSHHSDSLERNPKTSDRNIGSVKPSKMNKNTNSSIDISKMKKKRRKMLRKLARQQGKRQSNIPRTAIITETMLGECPPGKPNCLQQCLSAKEIMLMFDLPPSSEIEEMSFLQMCPVLMYQLDSGSCQSGRSQSFNRLTKDDHSDHNHQPPVNNSAAVTSIPGKVWWYSFISVLIISAVGLLSVVVIPILDKVFYNHLLQFLVALAVGALSGDALLHLIPHAMELASDEGEHDSHSHEKNHAHNTKFVWIGLTALAGIYIFFILERVVTIITEIKNKKKRQKKHSRRYLSKDSPLSSTVGAKLSGHVESCEEVVMVVHPNKAIREFATSTHTVVHECEEEHDDSDKIEYEEVMSSLTRGNGYNGNGHGHGHSHEVPNSVAAVAWMVILGDGIHNFTDGLAIGAAFASSVTGGISTSIAIFCHELPHEIGDFAVLLRAGMSIKKAIVYNCVSSILCLLGMLIGVPLGNLDNASIWIFAMVGGMFIYIALVDMMPEMTAVDTKKGEHPFCHLIFQVFGVVCGAGIMLLIAIYENDIKVSLDLD